MKILFVCGTYCPSHGGAEISIHTLLKFLKKNYNHEIRVITDLKYTKNKKEHTYDTIKLLGTKHSSREKKIKTVIKEFKPNVLLTQLMWSNVALEIAKQESIHSIFRLCKTPINLDLSLSSKYSPSIILSVSNSVKKYVKKKWNRNSIIIKPPIELNNKILISDKKSSKEFITLFNPLVRKGGLIFKQIAKSFPDKKFAVIHGWSSLKSSVKNINFSNKLIKRICESQGTVFTGKKPKYVNYDDCPNISILSPTNNVWRIYAKTKILLIPSQWEEAFGRVAIEAMANGIPTLGSNVGGLNEAIGSGGIIIKKFDSPKEWINIIKKLENKSFYKKTSIKAKDWVKNNYSLKKIINDFNKILKKIN